MTMAHEAERAVGQMEGGIDEARRKLKALADAMERDDDGEIVERHQRLDESIRTVEDYLGIVHEAFWPVRDAMTDLVHALKDEMWAEAAEEEETA
jgi:hypothetical protein